MSEESIRKINHTYVWIAVAIGVLILGYGMTPWDAIASIIASEGVDEEKASMIGFVAGYTLPLFAGFTIIGLIWITGLGKDVNPYVAWGGMAFILFATGWVAKELGLGQLPIPDAAGSTSVHPLMRPLYAVLQGYVNQYGSSLALASLVVAAGVTLSGAKLMVESTGNPAVPGT
jgi:hypothetical protein